MVNGYSLQVYYTLVVVTPTALLIVVPIVVITAHLNAIFCLAYCCKKQKRYFWVFALKTLQLVYGDELQRSEEGRFSLYGRPLERYKVPLLLAAVECIFLCVFISFYSELLFTESNVCSNTMDCFVINATAGFDLQADPVPPEICAYYQAQGYPIECFSFAFNYVQAIGNSGGVLAFAAFVMKAQAGVVAAFLALKDQFGKCGRIVVGIVLTIQVTIGMLLLILPTCLLPLPAVRLSVYRTNQSLIQFLTYTCLLPYLYSTTTYVLLLDWPCMRNCLAFLGLC